jgi:hypothetical protein
MSTKLSQYYIEIEKTQFMFDTALNVLENKYLLLKDEDHDLLSDDYSGSTYQMQNAVNQLEVLKNIHKFERVTKEQLQYLFSSFDAGLGGGKIIVDIEHVVTSYDTTRTISQKYNIPWQIIQDYNNISPSQLVPASIIRIPVQIELSQLSLQDISTFGSQQGNNILGTDITNTLDADNGGDLKVLSNEESFKQSIQNRLSMTPGSFPYYEEVGLDFKLNDESSIEERESVLQLRILNTLADDRKIQNVDITDGIRDKTSLNFSLIITAISGNKTVLTI